MLLAWELVSDGIFGCSGEPYISGRGPLGPRPNEALITKAILDYTHPKIHRNMHQINFGQITDPSKCGPGDFRILKTQKLNSKKDPLKFQKCKSSMK